MRSSMLRMFKVFNYDRKGYTDDELLNVVMPYRAIDLKEFDKIINEKKFKKVFGEINGEKNVRLPKELQEAGEKQPLIYNKQFYVYTSFPPEIIFEEGVVKKLVDTYKIAEPFAKFLSKPILNLKS